jgi:hypothetical protein
MTAGPRSLRDVTMLGAVAYDAMREAFEAGDREQAAHCAQVVTACYTIRIAGQPARSRSVAPLDILDHDDPLESETERYWYDPKSERRLERD